MRYSYFLWPAAALASATQPWLDTALPPETRLQAFLAQLDESQIYAMVQGDSVLDDNGTGINACIGHIAGNASLGIPAICMGDGPAGVGNSLGNVTTFPAPVVAASSWNTTLQYAYGQALAQEQRAKGRNVVLSPTINILRSPLWGRAAETFSEDPFLTARMAVAQVLGIQSQHALACPKHLAAYNQDTNRMGLDPAWTAVDAVVGRRALHELYLPAFKAAVQEAQAASVMCSYNRLNGAYTCENEWLLNTTLKHDWGFTGFVVADWYFADRSTVAAANNGLDVSMPGGSLEASYGFPAYYGALLAEAVNNGSVAWDRVRDMAARLWRPMFALGVVDHPVPADPTGVARTAAHLALAQAIVEEGSVLLKNDDALLPLTPAKYRRIAVFGNAATNASAVTERHGGFVQDPTMVTQAPYDHLAQRGAAEGIDFRYTEAFPGTGPYATAPTALFANLTATYWTTTDFSGPVNQTGPVANITAAAYPAELWTAWPDVFSARYRGVFLPNTTGVYRFSLYGQGDANLTLAGQRVATMTKQNFGNPVIGSIRLTAGTAVPLQLDYSMGYSLSTGAYGVTLGVDVANQTREAAVTATAHWADLAIVVVNDAWSEGADNNLGLALPADQDALVAQVAAAAPRTLVLLETNSAVLMPWLADVAGVLALWYPGQQVGDALARLLYGDVSPSGKLPLTFPRRLEDTIQIEAALTADFAEDLHVGYRAYDAHAVEPLFPFGHGLTYSRFSLAGFAVDAEGHHPAPESEPVFHCRAALRNDGPVAAKQVVQLYVAYPAAAGEPPKLLKGFAKVEVAAGATAAVAIDVKKSDLAIWDDRTEDWRVVPGAYTFLAGFSSRDIVGSETVWVR